MKYPQGALGFEVWAQSSLFPNKPTYQCMASFYYWQECLDYKDCYVHVFATQTFKRSSK